MEVKEKFVKLKKEDVGVYLKSYHATVSAAGKWKNKSVCFVYPKSGQLLEKHTEEVQQIQNDKGSILFNLLDYFKDVKVSDITHDENDVGTPGKLCPTQPHWATKIIHPCHRNEDAGENNSLDKSIVSKMPFKCPNPTLNADRRHVLLCDYNRENKLNLPLSYHGSEMLMPNGDQLFWVRVKDYLVDFVAHIYSGFL